MGLKSLADPSPAVFYYLSHYQGSLQHPWILAGNRLSHPEMKAWVKVSQRMKAGDSLHFWPCGREAESTKVAKLEERGTGATHIPSSGQHVFVCCAPDTEKDGDV